MEENKIALMEKAEENKITLIANVETSEGSSSSRTNEAVKDEEVGNDKDIEAGPMEPMKQVECRICQEEDVIDKLDTPCNCKGTLEFAHRECIQKWINERLSMTCEICMEQYQPNYTMVIPPPQPVRTEDVTICIRDGYFVVNTPLDVQAQRAVQLDPVATALFIRQQRLHA